MKNYNQILFIGDIALDIYPDKTLVGGCSLNGAVNASYIIKSNSLEGEIKLAGPTIDDSKTIDLYLKRFNIKRINFLRSGKVPKQFIKIKDNGEKDFYKYEEGLLRDFQLKDSEKKTLQGYKGIIVMPCYRQALSFNREVLKNLKDAYIVLDLFDLKDFNKDLNQASEFIKQADMINVGLDLNESELISQIQALDKDILITLGENGSIFSSQGEMYKCECRPVEHVIDSTGAGDTYLSTFLVNRMNGSSIEQSMQAASIRASEVVKQIGCMIPD